MVIIVTNSKSYVMQVCIDFTSRCVDINIFDFDGKKIDNRRYCEIGIVELTGLARLTVSEHIVKDILCLSIETKNNNTGQAGAVLKIGM